MKREQSEVERKQKESTKQIKTTKTSRAEQNTAE